MDNCIIREKSYRSDIDGLRAVAVLGVVLYHAGLGIPGGYVGVDIFFVISGFLITGLIIKDLERGTFSMLGFWERRLRRIFPALAVMVIACLIAGYFLLLPFGYLVLAQSAIAQALFSSNIQFWRTTGYFSPNAEENPLLHTWSLSVEEQFYLVVPLILAGLFYWKKKTLLKPAILIGIISSFCLSVYWLRVEATGAFYLLPGRAWELGMGSIVALAQPLRSQILRQIFGVAGLFLIVMSYCLYDTSTLFPGFAALPPVLGTAFYIWSGIEGDDRIEQTKIHRFLEWRPFVWIGLLSYSLYLWHWPFFAFHRYLFGQLPSIEISILYVFVAVLLSILSLKYVETPFRNRKLCPKKSQVFLFSITTTSLIILISGYIYKKDGLPYRVPEKALDLYHVKGDHEFISKNKQDLPSGLSIKKLGDIKKEPKILILGDSHAQKLLGTIDSICNELSLGALAATKPAFPPVFGWSQHRNTTAAHKLCMLADEDVNMILKNNSKINHVIMVFRWSYYFQGKSKNNFVVNGGFPNALFETITEFQKRGLKVTIMREVPIFNTNVPRAMALHEWIGTPVPSLSLNDFYNFQKSYDILINRIKIKTPDVRIIDTYPYYLDDKNHFDFLDTDGILLYSDDNHLTTRGAVRLKSAIQDAVLR